MLAGTSISFTAIVMPEREAYWKPRCLMLSSISAGLFVRHHLAAARGYLFQSRLIDDSVIEAQLFRQHFIKDNAADACLESISPVSLSLTLISSRRSTAPSS